MKNYIFITTEGYTFSPNSKSPEPDIENCQVLGFSSGENEFKAFENFQREYSYLNETTFNEVVCYELKNKKHIKSFELKHAR